MWSRQTRQLIEIACEEDLGVAGDITSALLPRVHGDVTAKVVPRREGIVCGLALAPAICDVFSQHLGRPLVFEPVIGFGRLFQDGDPVSARAHVGTVRGAPDAVLAVERTLLNFLGRMSGVATLTAQYVQAARAVNPAVKILDTRKTIPGWRELDKYAVRAGGGHNHRLGLYDAILIKDNHLAAVPPERLKTQVSEWLSQGRLRESAAESTLAVAVAERAPNFVEVEVDSLAQLKELLGVREIDILLLDNFSLADLKTAVELRDAVGLRGKVQLEASGGVTLETVGEIAGTGVERISVGTLTSAAPVLDIGLDA